VKENNNEQDVIEINEEDYKYLKKQWIYKSIIIIILIACLVGVASSAITYYIAVGKKYEKFYMSTSNAKKIDEDGNNVSEIVEASETIDDITNVLNTFAAFIDANYIGEIDKNELIDSTLKGFVEGIGDEYSEYMTAKEWSEFQASALGNYVGVGIYMRLDKEVGYIIVESTIKDTPAEKAGIKSGDYIIAVDDESMYGKTPTEVSNKVKGKEGTEVKLTVLRDTENIDFTLNREAIKVYHVASEMLEDNIGYISLYTFDDGCSKEFEKEMDSLIEQGADKVIIDLRFNTGGLVNEALSILDLFLDKDSVELITKSSRDVKVTTKSKTDKKYNVGVVLLVNEYSASASEILTGALKDNGVAKVVGTKTYVKGVIQNVYQLFDGSVLKLTTQEYFTPNETKIQKVGITPDYEVELPEDENDKTDTQLEKAKSVLKGE
jgi:carboxyl-terminal processing protease